MRLRVRFTKGRHEPSPRIGPPEIDAPGWHAIKDLLGKLHEIMLLTVHEFFVSARGFVDGLPDDRDQTRIDPRSHVLVSVTSQSPVKIFNGRPITSFSSVEELPDIGRLHFALFLSQRSSLLLLLGEE